jgi:hypothetical protein
MSKSPSHQSPSLTDSLKYGFTAAAFTVAMVLIFALTLVGCATSTPTTRMTSARTTPSAPALASQLHGVEAPWQGRFAQKHAAAEQRQLRLVEQTRRRQASGAAELVPIPRLEQRWTAPPLPRWQPERCWLLQPRPCLLCKPVHPNPKIAALALDASC